MTQLKKSLCSAVALLIAAPSVGFAQPNYPPAPPPDYQGPPPDYQQPPPGYQPYKGAPPPNYQQPPPGYQQPPPGYQYDQQPPPGYQGGDQAVAPPPGYSARDAQEDASAQAEAQNRAYAAYAQQWATANCIRRQEDNAAAGTIIGGVLGAVIGSNIAGGRSRGAGAVVGGALGAVAGNALARDSNGGQCPQGYVLRPGAVLFAPPPTVVYAAPDWYNPWVFYGGTWVYRPYPYHRFYRDHRDYRR